MRRNQLQNSNLSNLRKIKGDNQQRYKNIADDSIIERQERPNQSIDKCDCKCG
jgi:hypothetical protein